MAAPPLLHLQNIRLALGSAPLLDGAELAIGAGDRLCLVGRNGSGKSTLLRVAADLLPPDGGTRFLQPGTTVGILAQEPDLAGFETVADYVDAGLGAGDDPHRARTLLDALGLAGTEHPRHLSGGETRRAALARVLAPSPDLLLLDEPTNHLDLPAIEWLEAELAASRAGLLLISHDRRLLERVSRGVVWLEGGRTRRLDRPFSHFEDWRDTVLAEEDTAHHKLGRQIEREEDWMRYGVTARRKRNVRRVAELAALRQQRRDGQKQRGELRLQASEAATSGRLVAVAEDVAKSWPAASGETGAKSVVRGLDLRVLRGDRLGIVGPNGAGKSTLLGLLTGSIAPDTGRIALGASLELATLDQRRANLDPVVGLADTLTGGSGDTVTVAGEKRHVIGVLKDFMFRPEQARTPVGTLSGGERGRLALALAMIHPSNLLVLDEPTNDLDIETLDLLQDLLSNYPGTVLLVSHDRDFLDRVATSVLVAEGEGRWLEYAGGWSDMLAQRGASPFAPADARGERSRRAAGKSGGASAPKKLSFKDTHALTVLPGRIAELEGEIARHTRQLADPKLYARDRPRFDRTASELDTARTELARAEEQWLELEMRREALGRDR